MTNVLETGRLCNVLNFLSLFVQS